MPTWDWGTVNFWPQIAFAFVGLELCATMSEEVRNPQKTLPRAIFGSGILIALIYIAGTFAVLSMLPADAVDPKSGVFQALTAGSMMLRIVLFGVIAAILVTVGNAGGVGGTVAGVARVPFVVGFWADSSKVEDAVGGDFGAGFCDWNRADIGTNQRQP